MGTLHTAEIEDNLKGITHILVVMSGKGGVGKSTVAANLALAFALKGKRVGLLDCDLHGPTIPTLLGIEKAAPLTTKEGIQPITISGVKVMSMAFLLPGPDSPVIWRGPVKMKLIRDFLGKVCWGELDYLVIDLPPGTGDEPLSIGQLIPNSDGAVIVTTPQEVALQSVRKSIAFARALKMPVVGIVENMSGFVCPHCHQRVDIFGRGGGEKTAEDLRIPFLGRIPLDPRVSETGDLGRPFVMENSLEDFAVVVQNIEAVVEHKVAR